jgi:hypothetical protein
MKQFLIEFKHDSNFLGYDGFGILLVNASTFEEACNKIKEFSIPKHNPHAYNGQGFSWNEKFTNCRNFINLTIE